MNRWQEYYLNRLYDGKNPRSKQGKRELELLGNCKERVTVHFPDFYSPRGFKPAHVETYRIVEDGCDMPNGIIDVLVLAGNLTLWTDRGYRIDY